MSRRADEILDELGELLPRLEVAQRDFVIVDELHRRLTLLMFHYGNVVETNRSIQIAKQCDKAIRDVAITAITSIATFGVAFAFAKIASMCAVSRAVAQGVPAAEAAQFSGVTRAGLLAARARNVAASQRAIAAAGGWQNASLFARVGSEWAKFNLIMGKTYPLTGFVGTGENGGAKIDYRAAG